MQFYHDVVAKSEWIYADSLAGACALAKCV